MPDRLLEGSLSYRILFLKSRHLADSHDDMIRARAGAAGCSEQPEAGFGGPVKVVKRNRKNRRSGRTADAFCEGREICIITNDYNLNKVASIAGIHILNINDLSNALKPLAVSGEEMTVKIIREGKESGQGVGYLDDGTMVVVEGAQKFKGTEVDVVVTSVLQTSAGRMVFARHKSSGLSVVR